MVVVAVGQLLGGDDVVLVDHGDRRQLQQPLQGRAGVEVAAATDEVVLAEQHLGARQPVLGEHPLVLVHELALPHRGAGLQGGQVHRPALEPEQPHPGGHGPGGDQHDLRSLLACPGELPSQRMDLRAVEPAVLAAQAGGAHLDHGELGTLESGAHSSSSPSSSASAASTASRSSAGRSASSGSKSNTASPITTSSPVRAPAATSARSTPARRSRPCR
jgi:hypothetical protein